MYSIYAFLYCVLYINNASWRWMMTRVVRTQVSETSWPRGDVATRQCWFTLNCLCLGARCNLLHTCCEASTLALWSSRLIEVTGLCTIKERYQLPWPIYILIQFPIPLNVLLFHTTDIQKNQWIFPIHPHSLIRMPAFWLWCHQRVMISEVNMT